MKLSIGYSPCPNDCFIFYALVHHKIDTKGYTFDVTLADVEELNLKAFKGDLDITKLSYHAYAYLTQSYILLDSGSALGFNCGPLLICKEGSNYTQDDLKDKRIAIPGKYTTANFLLSLFYPEAQQKDAILFSDIEDKVLSNDYDAGLLIHENRFTYHERGLKLIKDLGSAWDEAFKAPIPLGGIVMKRSFAETQIKEISDLVRASVEYAFAHPEEVMPYVREHAQAMDEEVMKKHIGLYVNEYSISLGELGRNAINQMYETAIKQKTIESLHPKLFI